MDPLVLQNPIDATKNVGRNCYRINEIKTAFRDAYNILINGGSVFDLLVAAPPVAIGIARSAFKLARPISL